MATKKMFFLSSSAYYFLKLHLHQFSKIKPESDLYLVLMDPDPQHC